MKAPGSRVPYNKNLHQNGRNCDIKKRADIVFEKKKNRQGMIYFMEAVMLGSKFYRLDNFYKNVYGGYMLNSIPDT